MNLSVSINQKWPSSVNVSLFILVELNLTLKVLMSPHTEASCLFYALVRKVHMFEWKMWSIKLVWLKSSEEFQIKGTMFQIIKRNLINPSRSVLSFSSWECCVPALCCAAASAIPRTSLSSRKAPTHNSVDNSLQPPTTHFLLLSTDVKINRKKQINYK